MLWRNGKAELIEHPRYDLRSFELHKQFDQLTVESMIVGRELWREIRGQPLLIVGSNLLAANQHAPQTGSYS